MDLRYKVYEIIAKETHEKIKKQSKAYKDYIKYAEEFKDTCKELDDNYNQLIISLDKEIEEIKAIGKENERAIVFIDQKQEDSSLESFIIFQDRFFQLHRIDVQKC